MAAGLQIERMPGTKSCLELYVRAEPGWRDSRTFVEELDWRRQVEQRMFGAGLRTLFCETLGHLVPHY